ncbi:ABC transporter ATP-binding protein [Mucilaginibacter agri]|uniref:ATP-binding cassette domain-containing protein n=1 Tax=Mucilaginibacter agri TaxID=2695265 RepID=A0A966DRN3_9SPHI|nr:ABC transporter ATP-binding protein [Mucilaginibacter agri]NCD69278.1 ATP-binding cassette domain-containing protein [Mucilaginibacter agri]
MAITDSLAVDIQNLSFSYAEDAGVHYTGLNLQIPKGERFGLFGPNGAGKTTLMSLMTGLINADSGSIKLLGEPVDKKNKAVNKLFGFVPQDFSFYQELSPAENLEFFGAWAGLTKKQTNHRTTELLEVLGLQDVRNQQVQKFSGGMKRRVNLAIGVIHNPAILFLDEPTVGVDVQTRHAIIGYLHQLNEQGTTLVYTSHQLSEAEDLCNDVAMIDDGKIIAQGGLNSLMEKYKEPTLEGLFLKLTGKQYRD